MKDFLKYTLATITGIVIVGTVTVFFCILAILCFAISGSSDNTVTIKDNSVLVVNLSGDIVEHVNDNIFNDILGGSNTVQQGVDEIVTAIDKAAQCDNIKCLYLEAGVMNADYASLQEIRKAIERFKGSSNKGNGVKGKNGKTVVAYGDEYTQGAYYVCSAADEIWILLLFAQS